MIFTDYVPDYVIPLRTNVYGIENGNLILDMNRDGINDFQIDYEYQYHFGQTLKALRATPMNRNSILSKIDTCGQFHSIEIAKTVAISFSLNDTLKIAPPIEWSDSGVSCEIYYHAETPSVSNSYYYDCYDKNMSINGTPYYYFTRIIDGDDTLWGYMHIRLNETILDYAIEISTLHPHKNCLPYPNPFTNQINIDYDKPFEYQITDYTGRVVLSGKTDKTIATGELAKGCYLITIKNEEVFSTKKIVKQ